MIRIIITLNLYIFQKEKARRNGSNNKGKIFLGIDHTAIGISNTESSLTFYKDILGIDRKGESFNFGTEQEHLNNVEGASLHITGLRSQDGPGIEFLQYLKPGPGKPYPADTRADDTWYWQTSLLVDDARGLYIKLKAANYSFISKDLVENNETGIHKKSFIVKDPDGHAMLIEQVVK